MKALVCFFVRGRDPWPFAVLATEKRTGLPPPLSSVTLSSCALGPSPLSDSVVRPGMSSYTMHDFIDPLHWVPAATDRIVRLSPIVDRFLYVCCWRVAVIETAYVWRYQMFVKCRVQCMLKKIIWLFICWSFLISSCGFMVCMHSNLSVHRKQLRTNVRAVK